RLTGGRLRSLALTDNRRTILSVRPGRTRALRERAGVPLHLRIHHSFVAAGEEVLRAVAAFLASPRRGDGPAGFTGEHRGSLAITRDPFNRQRPPAGVESGPGGPRRARRPRRIAVQPVGNVHDLRNISEDLNQRYFEGRLKVRITWGKASGETAHNCRRTRTS